MGVQRLFFGKKWKRGLRRVPKPRTHAVGEFLSFRNLHRGVRFSFMKFFCFSLLLIFLHSLAWAQQVSLQEMSGGLSVKITYNDSVREKLIRGERPDGFAPIGEPGFPATYAQILHVAITPGSEVGVAKGDWSMDLRSASLPVFGPAGTRLSAKVGTVYPQDTIRISQPKVFRDVTYVDVLVFPTQWQSGRVKLARSASFDLTFSKAGISMPVMKPEIAKLYDHFFANSWKDKGGASPAARSFATPTTTPWLPPASGSTIYKIKVRKDGIYKLDQNFISTHTSWTTFDPQNLRLINNGNEIPIYISGEADHSFDSGDAIYFYGKALTGENDPGVWEKGDFTDDNVYWLLIGTQAGLRMTARDVSPVHGYSLAPNFVSTIHLEQNPGTYTDFNSFYQNQADTDLWLWLKATWTHDQSTNDSSQAVQHHNVTVPSVSPDGSFSDTLVFAGRGRTFKDVHPNHHVTLKVNGTTVGTFTADDYDPIQQSFPVAQSLLGGTGTISVDLSHEVADPASFGIDIDSVSSNYWELTYSRNFEAVGDELSFGYGAGNVKFQIPGFTGNEIVPFDVTDPVAPMQLQGATIAPVSSAFQVTFEDSVGGGGNQYYASNPATPADAGFIADTPSALGAISSTTHWSLIVPDGWSNLPAVQSLKTLRQSQGLNAQVVDVTEGYDQFHYGNFFPVAIKNFLQYCYNLASPAQLQYVTLLGDSDYDYKDYAGDGNFNLVPTYMVADPGFQSAFHVWPIHSFDNYFGCFAGNDNVPEIFVG